MTDTVQNTAPVTSTATVAADGAAIGVGIGTTAESAISRFERLLGSLERRGVADLQAIAADIRQAWADVKASL